MRSIIFLITVLYLTTLPAIGQESRTSARKAQKEKTRDHGMKETEEEDPNPWPLQKFEYGISIGGYFGNKYSANFYNGSPGNVNTIGYVLKNTYWKREIRLALGIGETDTTTTLTVEDGDKKNGTNDGYPADMHYNAAIYGGVFFRYNFNRKNSLFLQINYSRMKTSGVVTLYIDPQDPYHAKPPDLRMEQVIGLEGRVMADIGFQRSFPLRSRINLFLQGAFTLCYTQVQKSAFVVEGKEYSMVNIYGQGGYQQGVSQQTLNVNQNAFGFGGFLGVGAGIPLTAQFGIEPGLFCHYYPTNLEGYPDYKPSFGVYMRILLNFSGSDNE